MSAEYGFTNEELARLEQESFERDKDALFDPDRSEVEAFSQSLFEAFLRQNNLLKHTIVEEDNGEKTLVETPLLTLDQLAAGETGKEMAGSLYYGTARVAPEEAATLIFERAYQLAQLRKDTEIASFSRGNRSVEDEGLPSQRELAEQLRQEKMAQIAFMLGQLTEQRKLMNLPHNRVIKT